MANTQTPVPAPAIWNTKFQQWIANGGKFTSK